MAWEPSQRPPMPEHVTDRWLARCALHDAHRYRTGQLKLEELAVCFNVISQELWEVDEEEQERLHDIWAELEACYATGAAGDTEGKRTVDHDEADRLIREFTDVMAPIAAAGTGSHDEEG